MMEKQTIICPKCTNEFHIEDVLQKEIEQKFAKDFADKVKLLERKEAKIFEIQEQKDLEIEAKKKKFNEEYTQKLEKDRLKITEEANKKAIEKAKSDVALQLEQYKKEAEEKENLNLQFEKLKLDLGDKERDLKNAKESAMLDARKELIEKEKQIEEELSKKIASQYDLKVKEMEKQLNDQKKLAEEMKRKSDQGSMQLQGEVQELAIEDFLKSKFPTDKIEEIKKGASGGDCIQHINAKLMRNDGLIYYESKRTKAFQPAWIEKFKADMRTRNIEIGVIVTDAMPKDMDKMGIKNGVWICNFEEFKALSLALRESSIRVATALQNQENKGDKMELLYNYLTSSEFKLQIEAIVDGFTTMQTDLNKEKAAMSRIWKQREKQLEKVLMSTTNFYGSVQGIAGSAIPNIEALELNAFNDDVLDETSEKSPKGVNELFLD